MVIYRCGRTVKSIDELVEGDLYCIHSIGGAFNKVCNEMGEVYYRFTARKERSVLFLSEDALSERIKYGLVCRVLADNVAKEKTLKRLFKK